MAIDIDKSSLGNINTQIDTNVNLRPGEQTLQAQREFYNKVSNIGEDIYNKYAAEAGKEDAEKKYVENLDKGAAGDYSHVSQFTPYGKAYNKVMDKLAPIVLTSNAETNINELSKNILNDSRILYPYKVQAFANMVKQSISDNLKKIPTEYQASVALMLNRQANDSQNNLIDHVARVNASQQQYEALDSINKIVKLSNSASDINQSFLYAQQIKQAVEASINVGVTPVRANNIIDNSIAQIFGKWNNQQIKVFNDSLPDDLKLSSKQIEDASNYYIKQYNTEQTSKKDYELQNHYSQAKHIVELSHGINNPAPYPQSDEEIAQNQAATARYRTSFLDSPEDIKKEQQAREAGNLANTFKSLQPIQAWYLSTGNLNELKNSLGEEQYNVLSQQINNFSKAPVQVQNSTMAYIRKYEADIKYDPVQNLELEGKSPAVIYNSQLERGLQPKMLSNSQLSVYVPQYQQDRINTINKINNDYGEFAPIAIKQIAKQTKELGITIPDKNILNEYLLSKNVQAPTPKFNINKLSDIAPTLSTLDANTRDWINEVIPSISKIRNESPNNVLTDLFTLKDGNFVYKEDEHILNKDFRENIAKYINTENSSKVLPYAKIKLDPINNVYNIYSENNELYYTIPKENMDNIHGKSLVEKISEAFKYGGSL